MHRILRLISDITMLLMCPCLLCLLLLARLGVTDCANISAAGVGSCLRNLAHLNALYYSRLVAAIETVAVIDGDYIRGKRRLNITHLDQFSEYYEFENHPTIVPLITKAGLFFSK